MKRIFLPTFIIFLILLIAAPTTIFVLNYISESDIKIKDSEPITDNRKEYKTNFGSFKIKEGSSLETVSVTDNMSIYKTSDNDYIMLSNVKSLKELYPNENANSEIKEKIFDIDKDVDKDTLGFISNLYNKGFLVERTSIGYSDGFLISGDGDSIANKIVNKTGMKALYYVTNKGTVISVLSNDENRQLDIISSYKE